MAVIYEEQLKLSLKRDGLLPVYILFGEDAYLKGMYLNKISRSIADEDDVFNFSKFKGNCDLQEVYDAVMQMPVMADRKCVILNDFDYLHCDPSQLDRLCTLITEVPIETTFILYFDGIETDAKKSARFKKLISACEKNSGLAVALNHRTTAELVKMLCNGANKRGSKMDSAVGRFLVETVGEDINLLSMELQKLCAFVGDGVITKAHIEEVCTANAQSNIYKLSDYILAQNSTEALKLLDRLFYERYEYMAVFYTIASVFTDIYRVYCAKSANLQLSDVVASFSEYKSKDFLVKNANRNLKFFDANKISLCLETLVETDNALKSYRSNPREILEEMIVRLIYIIANGETID